MNIMGRKSVEMATETSRILERIGEQIQLARLRRRISAEQTADKAGISRTTLWAVEKGSPSVALGIYAQVLLTLGLEKDLLLIAADDEEGRRIQDAEILKRRRAPIQDARRESIMVLVDTFKTKQEAFGLINMLEENNIPFIQKSEHMAGMPQSYIDPYGVKVYVSEEDFEKVNSLANA
jgi:transcriptional regulator with XRE-family HTH domain